MAATDFLTGVAYPRPFDELAVQLCDSALRSLCILSPRLDHEAFDNEALAQAVSDLVRRGRLSEVKILVSDSRALLSRGHRLLQLHRRLPSSVHIRKLAEHPDWKGQTVVTRDRDGVLYKPADSDHEGFYRGDSRSSARPHLELFAALWRHSEPDIELRSLSI
ncbi:MAG: hypothetical protein KDI01_05410 [Halioglobus sp.]|nr:hypothetical protein [Halioglobus sp.]